MRTAARQRHRLDGGLAAAARHALAVSARAMGSALGPAIGGEAAAIPYVGAVLYPGLSDFPGHAVAAKQMKGGFGAMLSIRVKGGEGGAIRQRPTSIFWKRATSLGGTESLIEHRSSIEGDASTTPKDLLRLSVGLEDGADLYDDLLRGPRGRASQLDGQHSDPRRQPRPRRRPGRRPAAQGRSRSSVSRARSRPGCAARRRSSATGSRRISASSARCRMRGARIGKAPIDALIHVAGIWDEASFEEMHDDEIAEILDVDLSAPSSAFTRGLAPESPPRRPRQGHRHRGLDQWNRQWRHDRCGLFRRRGSGCAAPAQALRQHFRKDGIAVMLSPVRSRQRCALAPRRGCCLRNTAASACRSPTSSR